MQTSNYSIGDRIAGKFEIYRILGGEGKSGMGIVYVCYDHKSIEVVALKTFQDKYLKNKNRRDQFKKEALAWTHLERHPYIVQAVWVQELDYRLFVGAEYIAPDEQGRNTLTHYLYSPITIKQALTWGIQFCHGMEHACAKGVSPHRDIKPDNIMITQDGTLKITDFGLAGLWEGAEEELADGVAGEGKGLTFLRNERGKVICGTRPYMSPEQFDGVADVQSDIYSFGIVLYQMLNGGRLPFKPKSGDTWETAHKTYPIPSFRTEGEALSKLSVIIGKCLEKKSEGRYRDFREVREELKGIYKAETGEKAPLQPGKEELDAIGHTNKGTSLENLGLVDQAIAEFREALKINPGFAGAHNNLGIALKDKGLLDEAIGEFHEALRINPGDAEAHNNLGIALADKGLLDDAIKEYHEALRINPSLAEAHNNLGLDLSKKNFLDEAIAEYREALKINPAYAEAHYNMGNALAADKGLLDEAIAEFREALQINPGFAEAHNNLGNTLADKGLLDEAIAEFREALQINPGYVGANYNLGLALYDKGRIDEAIESFENFIKYAPSQYAQQVQAVKEFMQQLKNNQ